MLEMNKSLLYSQSQNYRSDISASHLFPDEKGQKFRVLLGECNTMIC